MKESREISPGGRGLNEALQLSSPVTTRVLLDDVHMRYVVLHYHIMKNAGTTIESIFDREFGEFFYDVHRTSANGIIDPDAIIDFLAATPQAKGVTSHHFRFPVPVAPNMVIFDCCPVRHPIDRLESLYTYFRLKRPDDPVSHAAVTMDLPGFVTTVLDRHPNYCSNVQTLAIGNGGRFRAATPEMLERATATIRASAVPAVVHRLDESMVIAEYFLGPVFSGIRLHYVRHNISRDHSADLRQREAQFAAACGPELFRQLQCANAFDQALFEAANEELDRRIALLPNFAERLAEFRDRCAQYADERRRLEAVDPVEVTNTQ